MHHVKTKSLILIALTTILCIHNDVLCQDASTQTSQVARFYEKNNPKNEIANGKYLDRILYTTGYDKANSVKPRIPNFEKEGKNSTTLPEINKTEWKTNQLPFVKESPTLESVNTGPASGVNPRKQRKKRSNKASSHSVNQAYCDVPFWQTNSFIFAVSSWFLLAIVSSCLAYTVYERYHECKAYQDNDTSGKPGAISMTTKDLKLYHDLSERRQIIKQITSEDEYDQLRCGLVDAVDVIINVDKSPSYENREKTQNYEEEYSTTDKEYEERVSEENLYDIADHYSMIYQEQSYSDIQYSSNSATRDENYSRYVDQREIELTYQPSSGEETSHEESIVPSECEWQLDEMSYGEPRQESEENASSSESGGSLLNEILMTRAVMFPSNDQLYHSQDEREQIASQEYADESVHAIGDTHSETFI